MDWTSSPGIWGLKPCSTSYGELVPKTALAGTQGTARRNSKSKGLEAFIQMWSPPSVAVQFLTSHITYQTLLFPKVTMTASL